NSSTNKFTANTGNDAIKVTATRTIPVLFAAALGRRNCAVTATAIAINNSVGPNFIGLNSITAKNNSSMGYSSSLGTPGGANSSSAFEMGSNGTIGFVQNPIIVGSVVLGPSGSYNQSTPTPMVAS